MGIRARRIGTIKSRMLMPDIDVVARAKLAEADKTWLATGNRLQEEISRKLNRTFGIRCRRIIHSLSCRLVRRC